MSQTTEAKMAGMVDAEGWMLWLVCKLMLICGRSVLSGVVGLSLEGQVWRLGMRKHLWRGLPRRGLVSCESCGKSVDV